MNKKVFAIGVMVLLILAVYLVFKDFTPTSSETFDVSQIIDGDTIRLSSGDKVRLIGINTPETGQPYYGEATEKLKQLIGNSPVKLEKDEDDKDQYGRLLRYVYVNDTHVNLEMVKCGMAIAYEFQPNVKYSDDFEEAEQEAKSAKQGIWTPSQFTLRVVTMHADAKDDDTQNLNDEYVVFENEGDTSLNLTGWMVYDEANNIYIFQEFNLGNHSTFTLYTGVGSNTENDVYWGSDKPIWNNHGDSLFLRDTEGLLVAHFTY
jgi:endonuclease YncB( thermonuclease family)